MSAFQFPFYAYTIKVKAILGASFCMSPPLSSNDEGFGVQWDGEIWRLVRFPLFEPFDWRTGPLPSYSNKYLKLPDFDATLWG